MPHLFGNLGGDLDFAVEVIAVARAPPGRNSLEGIVQGAWQQRQRGLGKANGNLARGRHFVGVAEDAVAGHVGHGVSCLTHDMRRMAVERGHAFDGRLEVFRRRFVELGGGGDESGAEGLGEIHGVARAGACLGQNAIRMHQAHHAEPILGLLIDDGMTAGDDCSGLGDLVRSAAQYAGHCLRRHAGGKAGEEQLRHRLLCRDAVDDHRGSGLVARSAVTKAAARSRQPMTLGMPAVAGSSAPRSIAGMARSSSGPSARPVNTIRMG